MTVLPNGLDRAVESQLIITCAQTDISSYQAEQIRCCLKNELDWHYILTVAGRNGVLPLISRLLCRRFVEFIPAETQDQLLQFVQIHTQNNLFLTSKLLSAMKLLEGHEIPILPFKGPSLAERAYGNVALRQFVDLDVLVKPKHFDSAVSILTENGYTATSKSNWFKRKTLFFTHKKDVVLVDADNRVRIELHWKLSGSHFSMPFEISRLWNRLEILKLGGNDISTLSFKDLFVYLCLHGSRHEWERLAWICDLHEMIRSTERSGGKIDWLEVRQHAIDHGCERVVGLGLLLVDRFFCVQTDFPGYERIVNDAGLIEIAEQVELRIISPTRVPSLKKDKYMYLLSLQEKRTHRLKLYLVYLTYYLRLLFTPNSLDKTIFHLPRLFFPLYFVLRPIRLIVTYFGFRSA